MNEKDPYKNSQILKEILSIEPYLSSYYDATREVMKEFNYMKKYNIPEFEITGSDFEVGNNSKL